MENQGEMDLVKAVVPIVGVGVVPRLRIRVKAETEHPNLILNLTSRHIESTYSWKYITSSS